MKSLMIKVLVGLIITGTAVTVGVYGLYSRPNSYNGNAEESLSHINNVGTNESVVDEEKIKEQKVNDDELKSKLIGSWEFSYEEGEYETYTNQYGVTGTRAPVKYIYTFEFKENNELEVEGGVEQGEVFAELSGTYSISNSELTINLTKVLHPMDFTTDKNGGIIDAEPEIINDTMKYLLEVNEYECELVSIDGENKFVPEDNTDIDVMVLFKQ